MPALRSVGVFASGTGALTVAQPSATTNDLLLLFVESANQAVVTPTGYAIVPGSPQSTGAAGLAGGVMLSVFWKIHSGTEASVAVADSGDHTTAVLASYSGVNTGTPFSVTAGSVQATATTAMVWPAVTTTQPDAFIILACAQDTDLASTATSSTAVNAGLTGLVENFDQTVIAGAGGGLVLMSATQTVAGSTGTTTSTGSTAVTHAYLTIALKNPSAALASASKGVAVAVASGMSNNFPFASAQVSSVYRQQRNGTGGIYQAQVGAYGAGKYVVVTSNMGIFKSSTDGVNWTETITGISPLLPNQLCYLNGLFMGPGDSNGGRGSGTSPDGVTWTARPAINFTAQSIATGNGIAVALGLSNAATTSDGTLWAETTITTGEAGSGWAIAFGAGVFAAVSSTNLAMSSTNGVLWTPRTIPTSASWRSIAYGPNGFIAVDVFGAIATSPDGVTWTTGTALPNDYYGSIIYHAGVFFLIKSNISNTPGDFLSSANGVTWVAGSKYIGPSGYSGLIGGPKGIVVPDRSEFVILLTPQGCASIATGTLTPGIQAGALGTAAALASASASASGGNQILMTAVAKPLNFSVTQSTRATGSSESRASSYGAGVTLVADGTGYYYSTDLVTWFFSDVGGAITSLTHVGSGVFIGCLSTQSTVIITNAPGGIFGNYSYTALGLTSPFQNIAYNNGLYVATSNNNSFAAVSSDGKAWVKYATPAGVVPNGGIGYGNGLYVATVAQVGKIITSPDGINWTIQTTGIAQGWSQTSLAFGNGLIVLNDGINRRINSSIDGVTWTITSNITPADNMNCIAFGSGLFLLTSNTTLVDRFMTSADGIVWDQRAGMSTTGGWKVPTPAGNGVFVAFRANGIDVVKIYASGAGDGSKATGVLTSTVPTMAVAANASASANASLTAQVTLAATATAITTANSQATTNITLSATATAQSVVMGAALTSPAAALAAVTTAQASIAATLTAQISLVSAPSASATASAQLTTSIQLAATPAATASSSGAITTSILLASSANDAASASGSVSTVITLAATPVAIAASSASLSVATQFAATPIALATGSGVLTTAIRLATSVSGQASVSAALNGGVLFNATPAANATASGALNTAITLAATSAATATSNPALTTRIVLASTPAATAACSGALTTSVQLAAASAAAASTNAVLTTGVFFGSAQAGVSTASAVLNTVIRLAATPTVTATATATLVGGVLFGSAQAGASTASASLTTAIQLAASPTAVASASAALNATVLFGSAIAGTSTAAGALTTSIRLAAAAGALATPSAALTVQTLLNTSALASSSANAALTVGVRLFSAASTASSAVGEATAVITFAASPSSRMASAGELSTSITLAAASVAQAVVIADMLFLRLMGGGGAQASSKASATFATPIPDIRRTFVVQAELQGLTIPTQLRTTGVEPDTKPRFFTVPRFSTSRIIHGDLRSLLIVAPKATTALSVAPRESVLIT